MLPYSINEPLRIGSLSLPNRLVQAPLAGYSCAPFRRLFTHYQAPAYCVSEMLSAADVVYKHQRTGRYLFRAADESILAYQLSGTDPELMAKASQKLVSLGADLIDINCGCPKPKIRKRGAGSALLENPNLLLTILNKVRSTIHCPLTVKIRLPTTDEGYSLIQDIVNTGIDALIVHGRRWVDDYDTPANWQAIAAIKKNLRIPIIANGDIHDSKSLLAAATQTTCDAFMVARAATGKPWFYQSLLTGISPIIDKNTRIALFMEHLNHLVELEGMHQTLLQSRSLIRYYFREHFSLQNTALFYPLPTLLAIEQNLQQLLKPQTT